MGSSCAYDSLAAGTPVIEFNEYKRTVADSGTVILRDQSLGSPETYYGLTLLVKTKEELKDTFYSNLNEVYESQRRNFMALMVKDASELTALAILE